jgi:hypothetical protein
MRIHTGEKPFKCNYKGCGNNFRAQSHLKDHQNTHLKIKLYSCRLCEKSYGRLSTLKEHLKSHNELNNKLWTTFVLKKKIDVEVIYNNLGRRSKPPRR